MADLPAFQRLDAKFDLSDPKQLEAYKLLIHRACTGWPKVLRCEKRFDPEKKNWLVYCEWCQPLHGPEALTDHG